MRSRQGWFTIMVTGLIAMVGVGHGVGQQIEGQQIEGLRAGGDRFGGPPQFGGPSSQGLLPGGAIESDLGQSGVVQARPFGTTIVPDVTGATSTSRNASTNGPEFNPLPPRRGGAVGEPLTAEMAAALLQNDDASGSPGMLPPANTGQRSAPQAAAAGDLVCFFGSDGAGNHTIAVVNAGEMQIAVYHIDRSGMLRLVSSRPIGADFSVTLNATDPLPSQIRHLQSRVK
ncbi:hypothetical protein U8335_05825 [Roseiconus lacunae]|uniref:hypothetical protein n=1 Tax=Roseiconus lacunae TaxID=2605694 RepID=UPI0030921D92|nr:hypothetical protein U8335_05825 [Stieleria sp. HD01]